MDEFYVYIYLDPRKNGWFIYGEYSFAHEPFYVGKGKDVQYLSHLISVKRNHKKGNNKHKYNKIRKILKAGLEPIILKIEENLFEQEAFDLEIWMIWAISRSDLKLGPLVNLTDGGEGSSKRIVSNQTKKKIGKTLKGQMVGEKNPNYGKRYSKEERKKFGNSGEKNPNYGKLLSQDTKNKIRKSQSGQKNHNFGKRYSAEERKKFGTPGETHPNFGKLLSEKIKEKMSRNGQGKNSGFYKIINPSGTFEIINNMKVFCLKYNLSITAMREVVNPNRSQKKHRGFKGERID